MTMYEFQMGQTDLLYREVEHTTLKTLKQPPPKTSYSIGHTTTFLQGHLYLGVHEVSAGFGCGLLEETNILNHV